MKQPPEHASMADGVRAERHSQGGRRVEEELPDREWTIQSLGQAMRRLLRRAADPAVVTQVLDEVSATLAELAPRAVARNRDEDRLVHTSGPIVRATGGSTSQFFPHLLRLCDQAEGLAALAAADIEQDGLWARSGDSDCAGYLSQSHQIDFKRAKQLTEMGSILRSALPKSAEMLCSGLVHADQVNKLATHAAATPATRAALAQPALDERGEPRTTEDFGCGSDGWALPRRSGDQVLSHSQANSGLGDADDSAESRDGNGLELGGAPREGAAVATRVRTVEEDLLDQARQTAPRKLGQRLSRWKHQIDPSTLERAHERVLASEYVALRHEGEECILSGRLTTERGLVVAGALQRLIGRPNSNDTRTPGKRRADALVELAQSDVDQAATDGSRVRPLVTVTISFEALLALAQRNGIELPEQLAMDPATWSETTGPVPPAVLERLACDSAIARVIFGPGNEIINAGTSIRTANPAQRRSVIARDRQCIFPDCTIPPRLCEIHHLDEWVSHNGPTNVDNLALLCWRHHHVIHAQRLRVHHRDGAWHFVKPDGTSRQSNQGPAEPELTRPIRDAAGCHSPSAAPSPHEPANGPPVGSIGKARRTNRTCSASPPGAIPRLPPDQALFALPNNELALETRHDGLTTTGNDAYEADPP